MTKWTAPDIASLRGDNSRPLQKIFGSLTEYLKDTLSQTTEVSQTYVRNGETTALTIGTVVYLDARQGNRATVKRAFNTSDATSAKTLGVVAELIPAHGDGLVTTLGYLEKVNTSAFTAGQTLYLGATAGTFTATKPHAPNHMVYVGVVVRANAGNGIIYVRCQNGYELDEIHDVLITSPTAGQTLSYDAVNSLWKNATFSDGGGLTNLNASNLASGTVPTARVSGSYTGITGVGTVTVGTWSGSFGAVSGANLTSLNASNLSSGTVASARLSGGYTGITALGTLTELLVGKNCTTATVAAANDTGSFSVRGNASFPAVMSFHRTGAYAVNFGLSTSNVMELGGWSAGGIKFSVNMGSGDVTVTGSLALSASTNAYVSYANTPDSALPWMQGPTFQGQTGWAFYSAVLGSYRMGFRSGSSGATRYMWSADRCLFGSQPNDGLMNDTVNVIGSSIWVQSMPASTGATVVNNFGFLRYVSSRRELKDNIVSVESSDGLDRVLALRPVEFTMKPELLADANEYTPFDVKRGFIAQETAEVDHKYGQWGWVNENQMMATTPALNGELPLEDATPIYWNHDAVIADLVASIQNINARLQQLETV
jgi:hypothetical protein